MFGGPMCDDPYGRYWQVTGNYVRRFVPNGLGTGELTEWSSTAWTDGELPRTVWWDDFTGPYLFHARPGPALDQMASGQAAMRVIAMMSPSLRAGEFSRIIIIRSTGNIGPPLITT
jgi:hypothetical protein